MPLELRPYWYIQRKYGNINNYVKIYKKGPINDDEMYEIIGLMALEKFSINLTSNNIADMWLKELYTNMFTAEKIAFNNLKKGIYPPNSGINNNIYFDFIGGQMKGELWGLIAPGYPDIAEKYAKMDAQIAHNGEGILREIFISRIVSSAFFEKDPRKLIEMVIDKIPGDSLYRDFINKAIKLYDENSDWRIARKKIINYWKKTKANLIRKTKSLKRKIMLNLPLINQIHVLPNIGIIILALLYGDGNFGKSICISGMCAYDTDCNCGNIGAVIGTSIGESQIPENWKKPINDIFKTKLSSFSGDKISVIANRICRIGEQIINLDSKN